MTPWEKVDSPRTYNGTATLTIYSDANGRINATADKKWFADFEEATFWADVENGRLGISPGDEGHSYSLSRTGDRAGADITTKASLAKFGITPDDVDETVHLDLDTAEAPPTSDAEVFVVADVSPLLDDQGTVEGDQEDTGEGTPEANREDTPEADEEATEDADDTPGDVDVPDEDLSDAERLWRHLRNEAPIEATAEEIGEPIGLGARSVGYYLPRADYDGLDVEKVSDDVPAVWSVTPSSDDGGDDIDEGESDGADDQADDEDEADAGGTHEPNPTTSPAHDRVHHAIDERGVETVQELADHLDVTVGRARTLAHETDRYGGPDGLQDKPPRPGVS